MSEGWRTAAVWGMLVLAVLLLPAVAHAETPLYGRLDAVCDFTSARWQDSLKFMEPNLSGVGGIHLGPLAETLVMRDVVPA